MRRKLAVIMVLSCLALFLASGAALAEQFLGLDYGPFHHGEQPGTPISDAQFLADLQTLSTQLPQYTYIRTYEDSAGSRTDQLVPLAAANYPQYKFAVGVHESAGNRADTQAQLDKAIAQANTFNNVYAIVVGNECTPADTFNPDRVSIATLTTDLDYVKSHLTNANVKVTTGLSYGGAQQFGTTLLSHCDIMTVHVYPFYAGPGTAGIDIYQAMNNLLDPSYGFPSFVSQFAPKQTILGETGWPSAPTGTPYGASVPSVTNEKIYETNLATALANNNYSGFLFEAFDEQWKTGEGPWGPHWGLLNADGSSKGNPFTGGSEVPLPGTLLLLGSSLLGLGGWRHIRKS